MKYGLVLGALVVGLAALAVPTTAKDGDESAEKPRVVVGTFDSRGVVIAYVNSDRFKKYISAQKKDVGSAIERAKAAGDRELVAELSALGPAMQKRTHHQGFGTAPIDDILAMIEGKLPKIAKKAGVDVIVSKWTLAYTGPYAKFVDVTDLLVAEFDPSEATLKMVRQSVASKPIPIDQLKEDH